MHCHSTLVDGRQEHDRGDGARGPGARVLVPLPHRPLALPARAAPRGPVEGDRRGQRAARSRIQGAARDRGEHSLRRLARRRGRGAGRARLGRRLDPHGVRPLADRAHPRRARQPPRRLHRPPDGAAAAEAAGRGDRHRARRRAGRGDRHCARDQLPAGPARHARHARTASGRGGGQDPREHRRALGRRARIRRARRRAGPPRVADEGADPEHPLLAQIGKLRK